mmetsp:Transcript_34377/g.81475  ORF Transcript_34377/g.81475 Transcript_34377/m.81475 type:complete len:267 (+) Transcript_34377:1399-2199(+)
MPPDGVRAGRSVVILGKDEVLGSGELGHAVVRPYLVRVGPEDEPRAGEERHPPAQDPVVRPAVVVEDDLNLVQAHARIPVERPVQTPEHDGDFLGPLEVLDQDCGLDVVCAEHWHALGQRLQRHRGIRCAIHIHAVLWREGLRAEELPVLEHGFLQQALDAGRVALCLGMRGALRDPLGDDTILVWEGHQTNAPPRQQHPQRQGMDGLLVTFLGQAVDHPDLEEGAPPHDDGTHLHSGDILQFRRGRDPTSCGVAGGGAEHPEVGV